MNAMLYSKSPRAPTPEKLWDRDGIEGTEFVNFLTGFTVQADGTPDPFHTVFVQFRKKSSRQRIRKVFAASRWDLVRVEPYQLREEVQNIEKMENSFTAGQPPSHTGGPKGKDNRFMRTIANTKKRGRVKINSQDEKTDGVELNWTSSDEPEKKKPKTIAARNPKLFNKKSDTDLEKTQSLGDDFEEPEEENDAEESSEDPEWDQ